jgi:hypothetical protein
MLPSFYSVTTRAANGSIKSKLKHTSVVCILWRHNEHLARFEKDGLPARWKAIDAGRNIRGWTEN